MALFLLVDGNSVAYRAFFALPTDMATASGQVTNAVYGFTSMLINLLKDHRPDRIAVAFDRPEPTFRHEMISDYKAGRAEAPDILRQQMGLVRQLVNTLHIPTVELAGFEADDIIATLATQARDRGLDVMIVTGDRDTYQLVEDPHIKVLYNRRGVSDYVLYDEAGIHDRTGVTPVQYPEYAALRGDPSDNLAGVPGVGEKTAAKLINTYGNLDGVFAHLDELTPKLRQNMAEAEAMVRRNAQATPLIRDVPVDVDLDDLIMVGWDFEEVRQLFNFLEFRTLWDRLLEVSDPGEKGLPRWARRAPPPSKSTSRKSPRPKRRWRWSMRGAPRPPRWPWRRRGPAGPGVRRSRAWRSWSSPPRPTGDRYRSCGSAPRCWPTRRWAPPFPDSSARGAPR